VCFPIRKSLKHQLLVYADGVTIWAGNISTIKRNTEALIEASMEVGLEVNIQKTKCMVMSRHQSVGQIYNLLIANKSLKMWQSSRIKNQNCIHEKIKRRLNMGNASYHIVQSVVCFRFLSENSKFKICKTVILPVILYGCETRSLTLRDEYRFRVFENRVMSRTFGRKRKEVARGCRRLYNEELHNLYASSNIILVIKSRRMRWSEHVARMEETTQKT
jgi:hypothetical protein